MTRILFVFVLLVSVCVHGSAWAHPTPGTVAIIDFTVDGARVEQDVPIEELQRALHQQLAKEGESGASIVARREAMLRAYAAEHVRARTRHPWMLERVTVTGHNADDGPRARFELALRAPAGEAAQSLELHDDIVTHEVVSHYTRVYVRSDWAGGALADKLQLAGTIHAGRNDLTVKRDGSFLRGFRSVVSLGMEHIATGTDHLLFLFALVLVAPVVADRGRWRGRRSSLATLLGVARIVTAFTVGHSLTLALGALGQVSLPTAAVESGIAASILITALHALRPVFPRREVLLAAAFGLIHGLAFASSLSQRDLGRAQALWTLLGFNVGIELAQLGLLALVLPWLLVLARTRAYDAFRSAAASVTAVLAVAWLLERSAGLPNPTAAAVSFMEAHPLALLIALAAGALSALAYERRRAHDTVDAAAAPLD